MNETPDVPIDEMKIKHIEEMYTVKIELRLDGRGGLFTLKDIKNVFGGPVKTRIGLIKNQLQDDVYTITIRGYVPTQAHHTAEEVESYVVRRMTEAVENISSEIDTPELLSEPVVTPLDRYSVEEYRGGEILTMLE